MVLLRLTCAASSLLALSARFLRSGHSVTAGAAAGTIVLLFLKENWARRAAQSLLALAAVIWLGAAVQLTIQRLAEGAPWLRMDLILLGATAWSAASIFLLQGSRMDHRFGGPEKLTGVKPDSRPFSLV